MSAAAPYLILGGCLAVVLGLLTWLAAVVRRRGLAGAAIGAALAAHDEAFRVTAHESHHEIQAQTERRAPLLSPDDRWPRDDGEAGTAQRRLRPRRPWRRRGRRAGRLGRRR
ncbi:hypothetical protein [Streptomyces sp. NPDC005485]|uniref:hypothetical protein n=1 Tax=Streptomyces sp. NPDC005485 TaxID=3155591 RepID=UPI0033BC6023